MQSFHAVVKPLGETRPAWKVLRVLANLLGLPGFDFDVRRSAQRPGLQGRHRRAPSRGRSCPADKLEQRAPARAAHLDADRRLPAAAARRGAVDLPASTGAVRVQRARRRWQLTADARAVAAGLRSQARRSAHRRDRWQVFRTLRPWASIAGGMLAGRSVWPVVWTLHQDRRRRCCR